MAPHAPGAASARHQCLSHRSGNLRARRIHSRAPDQELFGTAITLVEAALRAFLLAPILIAIHRFIILDEIAKSLCRSARRTGVPPLLRLAVRI
jgi:hypothetical protein